MNKIILKADCEFQDTELREIMSKMWTKIETINERTKSHTHYIRDLLKKIKELEKELKKLIH